MKDIEIAALIIIQLFCLRTSSYDPLEKAYQENKQLIAAYRRRIQNANKGRRNQDGISMVDPKQWNY